jgi:hypothetical protein
MKTDSVWKRFLRADIWRSHPSAAPPGVPAGEGARRRPNCSRLRGRRQRHRQPDRHGAHVQLCRQRHHQADGAGAAAADGDPRPQPAGHAERHDRGLLPRYQHHALPVRRPSPFRRPPHGRQRVRPGFGAAHPDGQGMRDEGKFQGGADIQNPPKMFIGAAANPFADPFELRVAGWPKRSRPAWTSSRPSASTTWTSSKSGWKGCATAACTKRCTSWPACHPMKSVGMARYMKNKVPGMDVPDELVDRMAGCPRRNRLRRASTSAIEQIQHLQGHRRRRRCAHHGHRVGTEGGGDRRAGRVVSPSRGVA